MADPTTQPESVRIETRTNDQGERLVLVRGRLEVDGVAAAWGRALRALPSHGDAVLDASGVDYCDGAGMGLIHEMAGRLRRRGNELRVQGLREDLAEFLALTHPETEWPADPPCPRWRPLPEIVGEKTEEVWTDLRSLVAYIGEITAALGYVCRHPLRVRWSHVLESATVAGAYALPVVVLIGFLLGWVLAFSAAFVMQDFGADTYLAALIGPSMVRELGPLMTSVVLAARSGSAFAAEIGTMKVNEEIDALSTMAIDPVRYLVTPKVLAAVAMTPLLVAFANLAGIVGGALVSTFILDQPLVVYTNQLREWVSIEDITLGMGKALIFGGIVAAVGCIRGLQTRNNPTAVGQATTSAVVTSIVFLALTDALLAVIVKVVGI